MALQVDNSVSSMQRNLSLARIEDKPATPIQNLSQSISLPLSESRSLSSRSIEVQASSPAQSNLPKLALRWDCVGIHPNPAGGKLIEFRLNPSSENLPKEEIFPALEPVSFDHARNDFYLRTGLLAPLGYRLTNFNTFILPDREALIANWRKKQELHHKINPEKPPLPNLTILSSDGIAGDREYAEAYITHGPLLSSGKEFVHDHFFHLIPLLLAMMDPQWEEIRGYTVQLVQTAIDRVTEVQARLNSERDGSKEVSDKIDLQINRLDIVLGMFVDILASFYLPEDMPILKNYFTNIQHFFMETAERSMNWRHYLERRNFDDKTIIETINLLKESEPVRARL